MSKHTDNASVATTVAARRRSALGGVTRRDLIGGAVALGLALTLGACGGGAASADATASTDASASADATTTASADAYTLVTDGKLTCVSDMAFPPMDYVDDDGSYTGYEVELMDALAAEMGLEVEWLSPTKFDTIIPLIKQGGKADVGASSFTITDERMEEIDFSDSYLDSNQGVATLKSAGVTSEDDLDVEGKKIAVQSGTTGEMWAEENLTNATIVPLDDPVQAMAGMASGLYDAVVADLPVMSYLCNESYDDCEVSIEIPTGEQYGLVVSKDNSALTDALNDALAAIRANGTEAELQEKWFGTTL